MGETLWCNLCSLQSSVSAVAAEKVCCFRQHPRDFFKGCLFLFSPIFPHFSLVIGGQIASGDLDSHLKTDGQKSQNQSFTKLLVLTYYIHGKSPDVFSRTWLHSNYTVKQQWVIYNCCMSEFPFGSLLDRCCRSSHCRTRIENQIF